ncbi:DUF5074 domain-containing protein [Dysgonomonas sp. Marseille-P4677]|uniref:DUF5074 domain-containing protein n=1 Tax=Dysgonomonas sp. Marseille-P4677 TaxID=2364790 RepID=UPI001F2C1658|nr:DUF5074 domain-containing protein [Dysgonomonas sp. Marseille-P4677]
MKNLVKFLLILLSFTFVLSSCEDYDDSFLKSQIENIKTELEGLKKQVTSVEGIVEALNAGKVITEIEELSNGKGYKISFNDATSIEVLRGGNTSAVGIKEEESVYYWTLTTNGTTEFLLDSGGSKVPVSGKDSKTANLSIDTEGYWTINGKRIKDANNDWVKFTKGDGDTFFKDIIENDESVIFVLTDDSNITISKSQGTFLLFESQNEDPSFVFKAGERQRLKIKFSSDIKSMEIVSVPKGWTTNIHRPDKYVEVVAPENALYGIGEVRLQGIDKKGLVYLAIAKVSIAGKDFSDPMGVFVLNEGNMTTENGSLIYIDGGGNVFDYAYKNINGIELGNVTQDLFIRGDKMYIIAQNGNTNAVGLDFTNDGKLVIANSKTMERITAYNDELVALSWPTHVAVLDDDNIFLRDNNGVHHFNSTSKELKFVEGSKGAKKNTMAVADNKVFAFSGSNLLVMEKNKHAVSQTVNMGGAISGVVKSEDGNIWVATTGSPQKISKVNSKTYEIIKSNDITQGSLSGSMYATPSITAKGNILYYGGGSFNVYRHNFDTGETKIVLDKATFKSMVPNAGMLYNTMAVHPNTGRVYINTIKAYGWDFLINNISVFNFDGASPVLEANYKDYTHFPAGIFFPANFN